MNYLKIQQQILKAATERDGWRHKQFMHIYEESEDNVYITFNYNAGFWIIPKAMWYLDTSKIFKTTPMKIATSMMNSYNCTDIVDLEDAGITKKFSNGKQCKVLKCGDNEVYVDEKNLTMFDSSYITFRGSGSKSPVYIIEDDINIVGVVLPVNVNKEK